MTSYINNIGPPISDNKAKSFIDEVLNENLGYNQKNIKPIGEVNKLSLSYVIDGKFMGKVVTLRHLELHRIFSKFWNLTVYPNTDKKMFGSYRSPYNMVKYEHDTLKKLDNIDIKVPNPIVCTKHEKVGVLITEFIDNSTEYRNINNRSEIIKYTNKLYEYTKRMHDKNIGHGDIQSDNLLINNEDAYLIDPTYILYDNNEYKLYDIACSIATASSKLDYDESIEIAIEYFPKSDIKNSMKYIKSIMLQLGYDLKIIKLREKIENI